MDILIQSANFKVGQYLETFVIKKFLNLNHDNIILAKIVLSKTYDSGHENNCCEINVEIPGNIYTVKKNSIHFKTAIVQCMDVLEGMPGIRSDGFDQPLPVTEEMKFVVEAA